MITNLHIAVQKHFYIKLDINVSKANKLSQKSRAGRKHDGARFTGFGTDFLSYHYDREQRIKISFSFLEQVW